MTYSAPIRFLRARKFDVVAAKKMLHECEQWRKEFGIEEIMKYGIPSRGVIHSYSIPGTLTSRKREMWTSITLSIIIRWTRLALSTNRCPCPLQSPFFLSTGWSTTLHRTPWLPQHKRALQDHISGTSAPASCLRVREELQRTPACLFQGLRTPRRNILHDP